jgi:glycosyltransferase involved in cell wall biosynthesis
MNPSQPSTDSTGKPRIAFVSTRIAGMDGVSLEIAKWAHVLERMGVECYYIAGELDRPAERCVLIEEAHFNHPDVLATSRSAFDEEIRTPELTDEVTRLTKSIRDQLKSAIERFKLDALIAENALTIPMNLPLGIALVQTIQEVQIGCLAHHHDFYWERDRFVVNAVDDLIQYAFPPALPQIQHVVINSPQGEEFSRRTGLSCRIIPNVMDFANPPDPPDDYARGFRSAVGLNDDDVFVLQPTRVVARKGIEHAVELVRRLGRPNAKLVISHASGDEGDIYQQRIEEYAKLMDVELLFVDRWIAEQRGTGTDGQPLFTLGDVFSQADLVTYPSEYEGFGNAFLEAIYYKKPVVCNRYLIYRTDIEPCGFDTIVFDGFLTNETVTDVNQLLESPSRCRQMVEHNYEVANEFFSFEVLEAELRLMVQRPQNIYRLLKRGRQQRKQRFENAQNHNESR